MNVDGKQHEAGAVHEVHLCTECLSDFKLDYT